MTPLFQTLDGTQSIFISRGHHYEVKSNDTCWWIEFFGREAAREKLVFYSEEELNAELPRIDVAIQEAKDAVGEWYGWTNGPDCHYVIRVRDTREPFHGGNFEYAYRFYRDEPQQYESREAADEAAARLNELPKAML